MNRLGWPAYLMLLASSLRTAAAELPTLSRVAARRAAFLVLTGLWMTYRAWRRAWS
jgi:hypothetical protein